jgi:trans-aconitate methyltransferase
MPWPTCSNRGEPDEFSERNEFTVTIKQWDASHYNESFSFIWKYGSGVFDLLEPQPGERILDLGCGTGHLTAQIAESGATVVGIDHSDDMVQAAKQSYPEIEFYRMDATDFAFEEPFDAIFSNAVLHWVRPPEQAIERVRAALKPGGRFVAEFGGKHNVEQVTDALVEALIHHGVADAAERNPWYFPSIGEYTNLLETYGIESIYARLYNRPTLLDGGEDGLAGWLTMFGDAFLQGVSETTRRSVMEAVANSLRPTLLQDGNWYADYRRLQIVAVKRR